MILPTPARFVTFILTIKSPSLSSLRLFDGSVEWMKLPYPQAEVAQDLTLKLGAQIRCLELMGWICHRNQRVHQVEQILYITAASVVSLVA